MPIELPHSGTVRGSGTWALMKSSVAAPASSIVVAEARIAVSSPDFVCISTTTGSIAGEDVVVGMDDEIGALGDDAQLVVGDDGGDLDDAVSGVVEPGHLEVHPHEHRAGT